MKEYLFNKFTSSQKYLILLLFVTLIGLSLRVRLSQDHCLHQWDEKFHALVSKNLLNHALTPTLYETPLLKYDYKNWYNNHIWLHKQPLPLWCMAISYKLFGISVFATRIPSILFSTLGILMMFLLGSKFHSKKIGLLAAFFFSINGLIIEMSAGRIATDHYDSLFLIFIEAAVLLAYYSAQTRKSYFSVFSGVFIGMAILTKWLPALIVLLLHYFILRKMSVKPKEALKELCLSLLFALLVSVPWQIYILQNFPLEAKWEYYHHWLHISSELDGQTAGPFYYIEQIRINFSEIIYLPIGYLIFKLLQTKFKDNTLLMLFLWIVVPIAFFSLAKTKMQGYVLFICPALFIITAQFFFFIQDELIKKSSGLWPRVGYSILLALIILLPIRYCFERTAFGFETPKTEEYSETYKKLNGQLQKKMVVLNVKHAIDFMFYNDCVAYPMETITPEEEGAIKNKGYSILYLNEKDGTLSPFKRK